MNKPAKGPMSADGPKGYRRTPESLEDQAREAIRTHGSVNASSIQVEVSAEDGSVTLTGKVPTDDQRREAEKCVASIQGLGPIRNELEIDSNMPSSEDGSRDFGRDEESSQRPATTIGSEPKPK